MIDNTYIYYPPWKLGLKYMCLHLFMYKHTHAHTHHFSPIKSRTFWHNSPPFHPVYKFYLSIYWWFPTAFTICCFGFFVAVLCVPWIVNIQDFISRLLILFSNIESAAETILTLFQRFSFQFWNFCLVPYGILFMIFTRIYDLHSHGHHGCLWLCQHTYNGIFRGFSPSKFCVNKSQLWLSYLFLLLWVTESIWLKTGNLYLI